MNHATPQTETPAGRLWVFALALGRWASSARTFMMLRVEV